MGKQIRWDTIDKALKGYNHMALRPLSEGEIEAISEEIVAQLHEEGQWVLFKTDDPDAD